jgi:hypothetical protein
MNAIYYNIYTMVICQRIPRENICVYINAQDAGYYITVERRFVLSPFIMADVLCVNDSIKI